MSEGEQAGCRHPALSDVGEGEISKRGDKALPQRYSCLEWPPEKADKKVRRLTSGFCNPADNHNSLDCYRNT